MEAARFYRYRTPYVHKFFTDLTTELGLSRESVLLDIGCGDGRLGAGLAPYVKKIIAVDASAEMLGRAIKMDNIEYVQIDLSKEVFACESRAHHALIGRTISYLPGDKLRQTLERSLLPGANVLVCGSLFDRGTPWVPKYVALRNSYGQRNWQDPFGEEKLISIGYEKVGKIVSFALARVTEKYLVKNALAYGSSAHNIRARLTEFRKELHKILAPNIVNGTLEAKVGSWAYVYSKRK